MISGTATVESRSRPHLDKPSFYKTKGGGGLLLLKTGGVSLIFNYSSL